MVTYKAALNGINLKCINHSLFGGRNEKIEFVQNDRIIIFTKFLLKHKIVLPFQKPVRDSYEILVAFNYK